MTFRRTISLECPDCARVIEVLREQDDPPSASRLTTPCPQCDDGDFHSPRFYDPDGNEVTAIDAEAAAA